MDLEGVLAMHPIARYRIWPDYLRRHPASLGETRILWMLARIGALIYNRTRSKGEQPQRPADLLEGLLPEVAEQGAQPVKRSMFEAMMTATIDHLREEHEAKQAALRAADAPQAGDEGAGGGILPPAVDAAQGGGEAAHG